MDAFCKLGLMYNFHVLGLMFRYISRVKEIAITTRAR